MRIFVKFIYFSKLFLLILTKYIVVIFVYIFSRFKSLNSFISLWKFSFTFYYPLALLHRLDVSYKLFGVVSNLPWPSLLTSLDIHNHTHHSNFRISSYENIRNACSYVFLLLSCVLC